MTTGSVYCGSKLGNLSRSFLVVVLAILSQQLPVIAAERPQRIVSTNLCTDQLLLLLADPEQVASISYVSLDPSSSFMLERAITHQVNHAELEELLALDPDLVVSSTYDDMSLRTLLGKLGYQVEIFPMASNLDAIRKNIRHMALLVGHPGRGEKLIAEMDNRIAIVSSKKHSRQPRALFYQARGYTSGKETLQDEALKLSGWKNISADLGITGYGSIDLERLLMAKPEQFFTSDYAPGTVSLAQRQLHHPALRKITSGNPMINIDYRFWICGGPMIADAIEALDRAHKQ